VSKQGFSSVQGYTDRLRNLGMSDVQLKQIAKSGQLPESIDIVAPADGFILARSVSPGLHFERAMEFYRIADLSKVWIVAQMFENEAQDVRPGAVARVSLPGKQKAITARVTDILPQVDPNTRTLELRLEADNPGFALRPEMFVDVELAVRAPVGLTIPVDAVVDFGLKKRVFVDQGNGAFSPREIETGWQSGDRVQVVKGLAEGERVVAEGTFLLDSESKLRAAASGAGMPESQPDREGAAEVSSGHAPTEAAPTALVHDPKCGMELDPAKALAKGNSYSYRGATYYFCSRECRDEFERDPGRFLATSAKEPRVAEDRP
jgi:Cu(I)/Ag(I) efflux system membrane fusion protein